VAGPGQRSVSRAPCTYREKYTVGTYATAVNRSRIGLSCDLTVFATPGAPASAMPLVLTL